MRYFMKTKLTKYENREKIKKVFFTVIITILMSFICITVNLNASETDQFLAWEYEIKDSSKILNEHFNGMIFETVEQYNKLYWPKSCDKLALRIMLKFGKGMQKMTDEWIKHNEEIDQVPKINSDRGTYYKDSIYVGFSRLDAGKPVKTFLSPTIEVERIRIGGDKISHMFGVGALYYVSYLGHYNKLERKNRDLSESEIHNMAMKKMIDVGIFTENTFAGYSKIISGTFSYADMEANFQGFNFYYSLCNGKNPRIVKNEEGKFSFIKTFDIKDYINPMMDESYVPNAYRSEIWKIVKPNLKKYCEKEKLTVVQSRFQNYAQIMQKQGKSFSVKLLDEYIKLKKIPDPYPFTLENACKE